jgi:tetratricopeptide (TPR) repeat protein
MLLRSTFALLVVAPALALAAATPSPQAQAAFDRAEKALAANQLDAAVTAYKEAVNFTPGYAAAINGLGSAYFKQGKRDDAIIQFRSAIQADPSFKLAYFNLGYAARKIGDFTTAAGAYEKYTQLDPNDPDGFYGLAESYKETQQTAKAIAAYETYLQKEKRPSEQKWVDKAKETLTALKAESSAPAATAAAPAAATPAPSAAAPAVPAPSAPSPGAGATAAAETPPPPRATEPTPQATPRAIANPALASKRIAEGDRFMQEKKYREASFAYQDAANADSGSVEALFKLGNAYAVLGYYAQAIERWTRAGQLSPDAAIKKSAQENIAKAQAKMAQAGGGSPQSQGKAPGSGPIAESTRVQARAAYEQGVQQVRNQEYANAVKSLTNAIQLEPTLTVAYVARGSAFIGLRRYAEAAADYQYALRLDGNLASPLYGLGEAYRMLGRVADARTYYEKYVASNAPDVRPELQTRAKQTVEKLR